MAKNKKSTHSDRRIVYIVSVLIFILLVIIFILFIKLDTDGKLSTSYEGRALNIELGSYQYDFQGEKAVKLSDKNVTSLNEFLVAAAKENISSGCERVYYWVMEFSDDKKQVLLNYGCVNPASRMFAVQESGKWRFISPTNQFDAFGVPLCSHVNDNNIAKRIAPVCFSETNDSKHPHQYQVR